MADERRPRKNKAAADAAAAPHRTLSADELRWQAEERLAALSAAALPAPEELAAALHELRVHQIELEMQNEELRRAQLEADTLRVKYAELFHLAPVGYFTLGEKGTVGEANLTAAGLLGVERRQLVGQPFSAFVFAADHKEYYRLLQRLKLSEEPQSCELRLKPVGGEPFWAQLEGRPQGAAAGEPRRYHLTFADVHKRVLAEEVLRRREEQLARAVEGSGSGCWDWHVQSGEAVFDERWAEIAGYTLAELAPLSIDTWTSLCHPDDLQRSRELLEQHFSGQSAMYECEGRMRHKDGHSVWVLDRGKVSEWSSDGRPLRMTGTHLGISKGKQAEEALRESEEQYRDLFESMAQGVVYQNSEGRIIAANPAAERILGLSLDQMQGRTSMDPLWRAIHEDGSAFPGDQHPAIVSLRTGCEVSDVVMGVFNPTTGSYRWMTVNAVPQLLPGESKPYRVFATFDDISERKRAEDELRETSDYLESLFGYANAPIIVWDAELRITRFNPAFEELTGRAAGEVVGRHLGLLFPEDERRAQTLELVTRASAGERWQVVEIPILRADDEVRTVLWNSATLYADDGTTPVATMAQGQDISARKQAEEQLRQRNRELADLNDELIAEAAALAEANATITRIAATDHLTGLANRRHFYESLEKAVSLARRHGTPLALVSLDLDGLKRVNDSAGHEAGDEVLTSFSALLAALCRAEDLPARLGGDEFCVLLPGMECGGAHGHAERVLVAVRACEALTLRRVTVSGGVAQWTPGDLPDDLLRRADQALYAAKRGGGDAVASDV
jgi:diguanylate cyclase (GGDEF)-like protein/PAS domain S-box-containing protein